MDHLVAMLRAGGDATRLRLLLLVHEAELTVSELTQIVGQSQPRVSRHLKLLCEAELIDRFKEGSWVFYRASDQKNAAALIASLVSLADVQADNVLANDRRRLADVRQARTLAAAAYFSANAPQWERLRALHAPEDDVEGAVVRLLGRPLGEVLDAGTGTGRLLELIAPLARHGVGIDNSPEMLAVARDRLASAGAANCQVRLGDVYRLPFGDGAANAGFDVVLFYQVLHFLVDPLSALREAARVAKPGGRVLIVDFAPHELEFLREDYAHRRLGFSDTEVEGWFKSAGLELQATETFAPRSGTAGLTVMVWLAKTLAKRAA